MSIEHDYVLGTHDVETARLGVQHRVWRPSMLEALDRAGVKRGASVIDVGAGPGFATLDLADRVGPSGRVLAVERSGRFLTHLREQLRARALAHVDIAEADLNGDWIEASGYDAAWCRWVACFVHSPAALVQSLARALRPGGVAVFHEYADYATWRLLPAVPTFDAFVAEVMASWRNSGGEPDIARALPSLLAAERFRVREVRPLIFAVGPSDGVWAWPSTFVRSGTERLHELGRVAPGWAETVRRDFDAAENQADTLMITPLVLEVIAELSA